MPQNLTNFVLKLAEDPQALSDFQKTPGAAMEAAGLTSDEQAVLTSNDPMRVKNAILDETGTDGAKAASTTIVVTFVVVIHPHVDEVEGAEGPV